MEDCLVIEGCKKLAALGVACSRLVPSTVEVQDVIIRGRCQFELITIQRLLASFGMNKNKAGTTVIEHLWIYLVYSPEICNSDVRLTSTALGRAGMTGWTQDDISQECPHEGILIECRREGITVMLFIVVQRKAETLPTKSFIAELNVFDSLLASPYSFVKIVLPHLWAGNTMTDKINDKQIGIWLT